MARHKIRPQTHRQAVAVQAKRSPPLPAYAIASLGVLAVINLWLLAL